MSVFIYFDLMSDGNFVEFLEVGIITKLVIIWAQSTCVDWTRDHSETLASNIVSSTHMVGFGKHVLVV